MMNEAPNRFAELAVTMKLITADRAREALREQRRLQDLGEKRKIGEIMVERGWLEKHRVQEVLAEQARRRRQAKRSALTDGAGKVGPFELLGTLGKGAMGSVYKAKDTLMNRFIAIKVLSQTVDASDTFVKRFKREIRSAGALNHPNIVCAYDAGEIEGLPYLAMELVLGETLRDRLKRKGRMAETTALELTRQIASGLAHAHAKGLVHRDIKPANILLDRQGTPKIADLGLAKSINEDETLTRTGIAVGTPHYMSPEQATGEKQLDHRSDIYSLGATLFHLLTGKPPFEGKNKMDILRRHVNQKLPELKRLVPELTDGTVALVKRMMAKEPKDRFACCEDVVAAIEQQLIGRSAPAPRQPPVRPADPASPMLWAASQQTASLHRVRGKQPPARVAQPRRAARAHAQKKSGCLSMVLLCVGLVAAWAVRQGWL